MIKRRYTNFFKVEAVHMALLGNSPEIACDLNLSLSTLNTWINRYRSYVLEKSHSLTVEQEIQALKDENAQLKRETKLLKREAKILQGVTVVLARR